MKLTNDNLKTVFNFIDYQLNDDVFGQFDNKTDLINAVIKTVEQLKEINNNNNKKGKK